MTTAVKERKKSKAAQGGTSVSVADLKRALQALTKAVPPRSPKPVLQNVLLSSETVQGTDLEMWITAPLDCYDGPPMLLPYARLKAIVKELASGDVLTFTRDGQACVVAGGRSEFRIPTEDPAEFPEATEVSAKSIATLPGAQFVALAKSVMLATDEDSSRYALGGVLVHLERPKDKNARYSVLSFVATDGRRLCVAPAEIIEDTDPCSILVPKRVMQVICDLAEKDDEVHLAYAGNELLATVTPVGDDARPTVVRARLIDGVFPPQWQTIVPKRDVARTMVVMGSLLHACRQAAICTSEQSKGVVFTFTDEGLHLTSRSAEYGEASVTCDVVQAGHGCTVSLDPRFVTEWLGCGSFDEAETIEVEAEDGKSAVVLRAQDCRCVVMPLAAD